MTRWLALGTTLRLAATAFVFAQAARAQCPDAWTLVATSGPPVSEAPSIVFDAAHAVSVLFVNGETWEWNGLAWQLVSTNGPEARSGQAMAYDPLRSRVVLFGGTNGSANFRDTWEWDGASWTLLSTTGPSPRYGHAMAFDHVLSRCVLFGGYDGGFVVYGDTWKWNGASWSVHSTNWSPGARLLHSMCSSNTRANLFGGDPDCCPRDGVFTYLGVNAWESTRPCNVPLSGAPMVFDSLRNRFVIFGGSQGNGTLSRITYVKALDGEIVPAALTGPSARQRSAMAYDSARDRVVLFGGVTEGGTLSQETWEFRSVGNPAAPTNAGAREVRRGVVSITWSDGLPAGTDARVERERWNGVLWSNVVTLGNQSPATGQLYDVPGFGQFRYRVQASACGASSPWSADLVVLPAAPGSVAVTRMGSSAAVRWTDNSDFESTFEVQRERRIGAGWGQTTLVATLPANATYIQNAIPNGQWRYRVRSQNVGGPSSWSAWAVITL